jgi:hypothetical protein
VAQSIKNWGTGDYTLVSGYACSRSVELYMVLLLTKIHNGITTIVHIAFLIVSNSNRVTVILGKAGTTDPSDFLRVPSCLIDFEMICREIKPLPSSVFMNVSELVNGMNPANAHEWLSGYSGKVPICYENVN